jgi:predicted ABC-type ATPase
MNASQNSSKQIFVIAGPNGSGKTTSARALLPELVNCHEYVNADAIAASLSPFNPDATAIKAGRLMLERIKELAVSGRSFAFETTLASRTFASFLETCKTQGYSINILFIWVNSIELAIERVEERVRSGGHAIPIETIKRRYHRSMQNFKSIYMPIVERWTLCDNSDQLPTLIAQKHSAKTGVVIYDDQIYQRCLGDVIK